MSTTIERATLGLAFFALGGVGLWTQCAVPSDAPIEEAERSARGGGRGSTHARSFTPRDGGLEALGDGSAPELVERPIVETRCWQIRVVDEMAHPAAALVLAVDDQPIDGLRPFRAEARTDADGALELCTPADTEIDLDAWTDDGRWGRLSVWITRLDDDPVEPSEPVTLAAFAPVSVVGRVVDEAGAPLADVPIHVSRYYGMVEDDRPHRSEDACLALTGRADWRSAADGTFELPIGVLDLIVVWAEDGAHRAAVAGPFAARPGAPIDIELRMLEGGRFFGTVVHRGVPIPNAMVRIETRELVGTQQNPDGTFDFRGLDPDEPIRIEAQAEGHVWRSFIELGVGEHELELERGAELEVRLELPAALRECAAARGSPEAPIARPSANLRLRLSFGDDDLIHEFPRDPDSLTRLQALPAGRARLVGDAFGALGAMDVELRAGETTRVTLPIELSPEQGILLARFAAPALELGLTVDVVQESRGFSAVRYLWAMDRTCMVLPAGISSVAVTRDDGLQARAEVTVRAGGVVEETFRLEPRPPRVVPLDESEAADETQGSCYPQLGVVHRGEGLVVSSVQVGPHGLLPGDRVTAVEGAESDLPWALEGALWGGEGTSATLDVERPDGSRARVSLPRTICD